jgi:hypothetical protein
MGKHKTKNHNWIKEDRRTVARKLAGHFIWVSADPLYARGFRSPGRTYRLQEVQS